MCYTKHMNINILSKENILQEIEDLKITKEIYKKETAKMRVRLHRLNKLLQSIEEVEQDETTIQDAQKKITPEL